MTVDDVTAVRGLEMNDQEINRTLEELGHGILALARDGDAYAVPVSFGFDGGRIFLYLIRFGDDSKKIDYSKRTNRACLTTYHTESRFDWKSVIVTGTLHEVADDDLEYMEGVMDDNAWFPLIYPPTSPITEVQRTELRIEQATGRKGGEYQ